MDNIALNPLCDRAEELSRRLPDPEKLRRCLEMVAILRRNPGWPDLKVGGWMEHVVTVCIENGVTTIDAEREFTRPIKHAYYKRMGFEVPRTIDLAKAS